jgi:hypothetical protein
MFVATFDTDYEGSMLLNAYFETEVDAKTFCELNNALCNQALGYKETFKALIWESINGKVFARVDHCQQYTITKLGKWAKPVVRSCGTPLGCK